MAKKQGTPIGAIRDAWLTNMDAAAQGYANGEISADEWFRFVQDLNERRIKQTHAVTFLQKTRIL